jgi:hypothetical protein
VFFEKIFLGLDFWYIFAPHSKKRRNARVAELVDALDSKSSDGNIVRVRFPPRVLKNLLTY